MTMTDHTPLPLLSSTEERVFKTCRLAHHFEYDLGFRPVLANRKLSTGIIYHEGVGAWHLGASPTECLDLVVRLSDERWKEILNAGAAVDGYAEALVEFEKDTALVAAMVDNYINWNLESGIDKNYETVEVEVSHLIEIPGAYHTIPVRMDMVQRNTKTGRLRVVDHKTARTIPYDMTGYILAEQNGNYQLAVTAVYDERPTELAYRFARKVIPSGRTKPPYFAEQVVHLTVEELKHRVESFRTVSAEIADPNRRIYASPDNCCGSWKNDWRRPCMLVNMGRDPLEALEESPGFAPADSYARYDDLEEVT